LQMVEDCRKQGAARRGVASPEGGRSNPSDP